MINNFVYYNPIIKKWIKYQSTKSTGILYVLQGFWTKIRYKDDE